MAQWVIAVISGNQCQSFIWGKKKSKPDFQKSGNDTPRNSISK